MMNFAFKGTDVRTTVQTSGMDQTLSLSLKMMQLLLQESLQSMQRQLRSWRLVAGVVEGGYYDQAGIQALSEVPSREELLGKLLGSIQSPIANFARVISQIAEAKEA